MAGAGYGFAQQYAYDTAANTVSPISTYLKAELSGAAQGAGTAATFVLFPAAKVLDAYGYVQTAKTTYDFYSQVLSQNQVNYSAREQRDSGAALWLDVVGRFASARTPTPVKDAYTAVLSMLDTLRQSSTRGQTLQPWSTSNARTGLGQPSIGNVSSGLPSTVSQSGVTYVRNSSGLLNIAN